MANKQTPAAAASENSDAVTGSLPAADQIADLQTQLQEKIKELLSTQDELTGMTQQRDELATQLKAKLEELTSTQDELTGMIQQRDELATQLKAKLEELTSTQDELTGMTQQHDELATLLEAKNQEITELLGINNRLTSMIDATLTTSPVSETALNATAAAEPVDLSSLSFEKDGRRYGFNWSKIRIDGKPVTAAEICQDTALQDRLVGMGSHMLSEL